MAREILAADLEQSGAAPQKGNYTTESHGHLWCASALSHVVSNQESFAMWNDDIQLALRYLLACEIDRAKAAAAAEDASRTTQGAS